MAEVPIKKDKLTRKKIQIYLIQVVCDTGDFIRPRRPRETDEILCIFMLSFDEKETVMETYDWRTKKYDLMGVNCGKLSKDLLFRFFSVFLCLRVKNAPFFGA